MMTTKIKEKKKQKKNAEKICVDIRCVLRMFKSASNPYMFGDFVSNNNTEYNIISL